MYIFNAGSDTGIGGEEFPMSEYLKPLPEPDEFSGPYWQGALEGKLLIQKCSNCGAYQNFPRGICPGCLTGALEWVAASGRGIVYSYTNVYRAPTPEFAGDGPYTVALIELAEGTRMMSNLVECPPEKVEIGMPVEVVFDRVTPEMALPKFRPAKC